MLRLESISKSFPGVKALQSVSLQIRGGEVHAIAGENGAGKSTLMKIIAGDLIPDEGTLFADDVALTHGTARAALGIGFVYQERSLAENLSVAENIFPNKQPRNSFGFIKYDELHRQANALLDRLAIGQISTATLVGSLSPGQKQMVEIAKALASPCKTLILDEPTASITYEEVVTLFRIIEELKRAGTAIIYISHRMDEIKQIADVVSVLKDGKLQATVRPSEISIDKIITLMVGRELPRVSYQRVEQNEVALTVQQLSGVGFDQINFDLHKGEILGFSGLVGAGRTEMALAILGDVQARSGNVYLGKEKLNIAHPMEAIEHGIVYVPEDRKRSGIFPEMSVMENMVVSRQWRTWCQPESDTKDSETYIRLLNIKVSSTNQAMASLSGGNQQKVILARWLMSNPKILIVDEPTHGIDVGSKFEIYELLKSLRQEGLSIIVISSDLPELLLICDRIAVMYKGNLQRILGREEATEENIMHLASGKTNKSND